MWHTSSKQRTETGKVLPRLIVDGRRAATLYEGEDRREANRVFAETYHLAQAWLAWHGDRELVFMSTDCAYFAAQAAALLRVHGGGVTLCEGRFLNHGRLVADYLAEAFTELIRDGHLALGQPDPVGMRRVCVTRTGQLRYAELNTNGVRGAGRHDRQP